MAIAVALLGTSGSLMAQAGGPDSVGPTAHVLDSLVLRAVTASPRLVAARARIEAAEARVRPAALRPDPMLMAGIQNLPVSDPDFAEPMTMKMLGVSQTLPAPGKLAAARRVAEHEVSVARAHATVDSLRLVRDVRTAYYDIAYIDRALAIVNRTRNVLASLVGAAEARLGAGTGGQVDVLRARVEAARLGVQASELLEERRSALARLNATLSRGTEEPLAVAVMPASLTLAAVAATPAAITFTSPTLGSRTSSSPLPPLEVLQQQAMRNSPLLRAHHALVAAQEARARRARLERRPDIDVSVNYGQRDGFRDMVSAVVSLPLPLQRGRKQDALAAAARSETAALEAGVDQQRNEIAAEVARLHSQIESARTQLALIVKAILPQSRATLESAISAYQAGRADFTAVLEAQAALFNTETSYHRLLSDFARTLAELELAVGTEVLPNA